MGDALSRLKSIVWTALIDPVLRKIESRLAHFQSFRSTTHSGERWSGLAVISPTAKFYPEASIENAGERTKLQIEGYCNIRGQISVQGSGQFRIGTHSFLGPGSRIWCRNKVVIGSHVLISHLVDIHDSDSHSLFWEDRHNETIDLFEKGMDIDRAGVKSGPITIGDDAWIGLKSTILAGVSIGRGAVVAAGSVVTRDVPPFCLVAGNPARVIRVLTQERPSTSPGVLPE